MAERLPGTRTQAGAFTAELRCVGPVVRAVPLPRFKAVTATGSWGELLDTASPGAEHGVVLGHLERATEEIRPFDQEQVRSALAEIDQLRDRIGSGGLTLEEILDSIAEGRA